MPVVLTGTSDIEVYGKHGSRLIRMAIPAMSPKRLIPRFVPLVFPSLPTSNSSLIVTMTGVIICPKAGSDL